MNSIFGFRLILAAALFAFVAGCSPAEEPGPVDTRDTMPEAGTPVALWEATAGVDTPESVYLDEGSGYLFVSMIAGEPDAKDGNGRIAQLDRDGTVLSEDWVTGFNAPKGLRSQNGTLWTADIDEIIAIDIATAGILSRTRVEGALFLNDVAVGEDGTVYVSDMAASRIYALADGQVEIFAEGPDLEYPNGLIVDGGRLIVGGWGEPGPDFSTEVPGRLYALDLGTREKTLITPEPLANIDGVESDGAGGWVVTDYMAGKLIHIAADGTATDLAAFGAGTADLAFVAGDGTAFVPHMQENRVAAYALGGLLP